MQSFEYATFSKCSFCSVLLAKADVIYFYTIAQHSYPLVVFLPLTQIVIHFLIVVIFWLSFRVYPIIVSPSDGVGERPLMYLDSPLPHIRKVTIMDWVFTFLQFLIPLLVYALVNKIIGLGVLQ
ncbi:MAG: hypothetical protein P8M34_07825 [Saprospiraceae bacterium]|nr:hypothetical protein [Saprospiraceae bacterium]